MTDQTELLLTPSLFDTLMSAARKTKDKDRAERISVVALRIHDLVGSSLTEDDLRELTGLWSMARRQWISKPEPVKTPPGGKAGGMKDGALLQQVA